MILYKNILWLFLGTYLIEKLLITLKFDKIYVSKFNLNNL